MHYPGGKGGAGVYHSLINLMPPHPAYIEPFVGGGAILRMKRPALVNIGVDLDKDVITAWRRSSSTLTNGGAADIWIPSPKVARTAAIVQNRAGRSHTAETGEARRRRSRESPVEASSAGNSGTAGRIAQSSGTRSRFEFVLGDGIDFLRSYPFTGQELVYADPPYLHSVRSKEMLYAHEMSEGAHEELLSVLTSLKCRVMVSGYSSALYAGHLKSWNAACYKTITRWGPSVAEWVWYNYERPVALHDYRFLGSDYREREQIKRQKTTWVNRLRKMPAIRRQALLSAIADTA